MVKWLFWLAVGIVIGAFFGMVILGWFWENLQEGARMLLSSFKN